MFIHDHAVNGQDYSNNYFVTIFNKSGYTKDTHIVKNIAKGTTDPGVDCFDQ